jgi:pimeloyl-ACP methyl ester carboxylesterase
MEAEAIAFQSDGVACRGRLWRSQVDDFTSDAGVPCIILAKGFGGTIDCGLQHYGPRFAAAGLHALAFDYRHFGISDGEPRQLLNITGQIRDYLSAAGAARAMPEVDPDRIVYWGTSLSGGHVVCAAALDPRAAAIIAQCPMMDGLAAMQMLRAYAGPERLLKVVRFAVRDLLRSWTRRPPVTVPIVGPPGSLAAMSSPDAESGYRSITPPDWINEVCARIGLAIPFYRPIHSAAKVRCPALIQVADRDTVTSVKAVDETAKRLGGRAELQHFDCGHFDIYLGEVFERAVQQQIAFVGRVLGKR